MAVYSNNIKNVRTEHKKHAKIQNNKSFRKRSLEKRNMETGTLGIAKKSKKSKKNALRKTTKALTLIGMTVAFMK